ncbi:MAG: hypothetical protein ACFE96_07295, partial [Candidatus Hermodarchaeota archaeon]
MSDLKQFLELHKLLLSGDYLIDGEITFLDFMKVLKVLYSSKKFTTSLKKAEVSFSTMLGILEFLRNVSIIELNKKGQLRIHNEEILDQIYKPLNKIRLKLKLLVSNKKKIFFYSNNNNSLLRIYAKDFKLSKVNFQLPCSIKTSLSRAITIVNNIYFKTQNALFIGDDDMVSLLVKCLVPELP